MRECMRERKGRRRAKGPSKRVERYGKYVRGRKGRGRETGKQKGLRKV